MITFLLRWLIRQLLKLLHILDPMADLTHLTDEVNRSSTLSDAAVAKLTSTPPDQQPAIDALTAELKSGNDKLDAALNPPTPTP